MIVFCSTLPVSFIPAQASLQMARYTGSPMTRKQLLPMVVSRWKDRNFRVDLWRGRPTTPEGKRLGELLEASATNPEVPTTELFACLACHEVRVFVFELLHPVKRVDPRVSEARRKAVQARWDKPGAREAQSARMQARWGDAQGREKLSAVVGRPRKQP